MKCQDQFSEALRRHQIFAIQDMSAKALESFAADFKPSDHQTTCISAISERFNESLSNLIAELAEIVGSVQKSHPHFGASFEFSILESSWELKESVLSQQNILRGLDVSIRHDNVQRE